MKTSRNTSTLQGLFVSVLGTEGDETGHFTFGDLDFFAAKGSERNVGDLQII